MKINIDFAQKNGKDVKVDANGMWHLNEDGENRVIGYRSKKEALLALAAEMGIEKGRKPKRFNRGGKRGFEDFAWA